MTVNPAGTHTFQAKAQDNSGQRADAASAQLRVRDLPPTATPVPTRTPIPTATPTPRPRSARGSSGLE